MSFLTISNLMDGPVLLSCWRSNLNVKVIRDESSSQLNMDRASERDGVLT